jgi:hypothetical protein
MIYFWNELFVLKVMARTGIRVHSGQGDAPPDLGGPLPSSGREGGSRDKTMIILRVQIPAPAREPDNDPEPNEMRMRMRISPGEPCTVAYRGVG